MQNSASIKPILYPQKTLKNGKHPIMIQIIKDRKVRRISLGYSATVKQWDFTNNKPTKHYPERIELEAVIRKKISDLAKQILELDLDEKSYTTETIVLNAKRKRKSVSVVNYMEEIISSLKTANRIGNSEQYQTCKNALLAFNKGKDMNFNQIDFSFLNKFENWFKSRDCKQTTISSYQRTLRATFNRAINENIISPELYPYKQYKIGKLNTTTQKRAIKEIDIVKIEEQNFETDTRLFLSRNIFLFSYYTIGTNFIDIANLTWESVKDGRVKYHRAKTHKPFSIVLTPKAIEILRHYKRIKTDKYIFPIFSEDTHISATQKNNRLHKVLKQTNEDLKVIAGICGITENLTTYVARHSAATILKRKGISTTMISELLGHETEEITQTYLDTFENIVLDKAVGML